MFSNRLFYLLIVIALIVVTSCTPRIAPTLVPTVGTILPFAHRLC